MRQFAVWVLALGGSALVLLAGVGVVRFGDLYRRMHAATKATTAGLALVGSACALAVPGTAPKVALVVVAVFVTTPVAAHLIARAADQSAPNADREGRTG